MQFDFDLLLLTSDELWAIHDYVRQHDKQGQEWDKSFETRLLEALIAADEHPAHEAAMLISEEELWSIDRQVPPALTVGTAPVGRNVIVKAARLLLKLKNGGDDDDRYSGNAASDWPSSSCEDTLPRPDRGPDETLVP